jgi:plastocyanin
LVYKVLVDDTLGFKQVRIEPNNPDFKYDNLTLMINPGDSVIWINNAYDPSGNAYNNNVDITIVSVQNLWDSQSGYLKYYRRSFNYTFNQPGTYEVYMKEYPRVRHQTIIVAPSETPAITTPVPTPTATETPAPTASIQTPQTATPGFDLWYILLAFIVVAGLVVFIYSIKKK